MQKILEILSVAIATKKGVDSSNEKVEVLEGLIILLEKS
jgi:hypothetical protein